MVLAVCVLLVAGAAEVLFLQRDDDTNSTTPVAAQPSDSASADVTVDQPVQVSQDEWLAVVAQSATAATTILSADSTSADGYDAQVDAGAKLMTDPFAEEFRTTKADVKQDFLAAKTKVSVDISWQGVVSATPQEVKTLLFLTQSTTKGGTGLTAVQFRVTVTMLNTPDGWLVADLQAS